MDDMTGTINNILNDPEQMKKVMEMAGQIMGKGGDAAASPPPEGQTAPSLGSILSSLGGNSGGADPQLSNLLGGVGAKLGGLFGGGASPLGNLFGGGAGLQNMIQNAARSFNSGNDKKQLIEALKPYLSESRQRKLDRAMVFAKVMHVAGAAALLGGGPK